MPSADPNSLIDAGAEHAASARLIRRTLQQWPLVVACALVAAVAGYVASSSRTAQYESTTTMQLSEVDLQSLFLAQNLQQQGQDAAAKAATSAQLITLPRVQQRVADVLAGQVTKEELDGAVSVSARTGTTLVEITARHPDPVLAARIADETRTAFVKTRRLATVTQFRGARSNVQDQLDRIPEDQRDTPAAQVLAGRLQQLETLILVSGGGVETVQPATVPTAPVSPSPKRDAILALFAGGLLGLGIALLRARLDDRIRDLKELSECWDLPALGLIPETPGLARQGRNLPGGPALEAFGLARTNLQYVHVGGEVRTLLVTSAVEGEGKSTVAWNLAVAAALADSKVLLIEADLRRPVHALRLGLTNRYGLSELLAGMATIEQAAVGVGLGPRGELGTVDVIPAGMVPPSPIALLERPGAGQLLKEMSAIYELVIVDSPPATVVADAKVLSALVDGVVVVSRLGYLRRGGFERLRDLLGGHDTPVLGTIVNGGAPESAYGYSSYTSASARAPAPVAAPSPATRS